MFIFIHSKKNGAWQPQNCEKLHGTLFYRYFVHVGTVIFRVLSTKFLNLTVDWDFVMPLHSAGAWHTKMLPPSAPQLCATFIAYIQTWCIPRQSDRLCWGITEASKPRTDCFRSLALDAVAWKPNYSADLMHGDNVWSMCEYYWYCCFCHEVAGSISFVGTYADFTDCRALFLSSLSALPPRLISENAWNMDR